MDIAYYLLTMTGGRGGEDQSQIYKLIAWPAVFFNLETAEKENSNVTQEY
jgi:hypothetical protein